MDRLIIDFLEKAKLASVCCLDEEKNPYCFTIFYVFDKIERRLYFKSSRSSHHASYLLQNKRIAGTVMPDKLNMLAIRGIQFTGFIMDNSHELQHHASTAYHKKFPFAITMDGDMWAIQLESVKLTDNTVVFGKKISWHREDLYEEIC